MQFIIKNTFANKNWFSWRILKDARTVILFHKLKASEQKLNEYLKANYNLDLKLACIHLIQHCKIYKDLDQNIIILFPVKKDDKLASLITYGNNEVNGSDILKQAFFRKD